MSKESTTRKIKYIILSVVSLVLICAAVVVTILNTYKPMFEVTINNEFIGYFKSRQEFDEVYQTLVNEKLQLDENAKVFLDTNPVFKQTFVKASTLDNNNLYTSLRAQVRAEYTTYAVLVNDEKKMEFQTKDEADKYAKSMKDQINTLNVAVNEQKTAELTNVNNVESANAILKDIVSRHKPVEEPKPEPKPQPKPVVKKKTTPKQSGRTTPNQNYVPVPSASGGVWPTVSRRISVGFGGYSGHTGMDIDGHTGDANVAYKAGKVVFAGWSGAYGYLVKVDHGDGVQSWYAHNSKILVSAGQNVAQGQLLALQGSTGRSTGDHLHFEIRINGRPVNPYPYIR